MRFSTTRRFPVPRDQLWAALQDPAALQAAIPGCEVMTGSVEEGLKLMTRRYVGPIPMTFHAEITFSDIEPGERFTISGIGKGGLVGSATGQATVTLTELGAALTELSYSAEVELPLKLGRSLTRRVEQFTVRLADGFFQQLARSRYRRATMDAAPTARRA